MKYVHNINQNEWVTWALAQVAIFVMALVVASGLFLVALNLAARDFSPQDAKTHIRGSSAVWRGFDTTSSTFNRHARADVYRLQPTASEASIQWGQRP